MNPRVESENSPWLKDTLIGITLGLLLFGVALACDLHSRVREVAAAKVECSP